MRRLVLATTLALMAATAGAATLSGVNVDDTANVNGQNLVLNGAGMRKKLFIKIYIGALYLPAKQSNAGAILAADTPRRMALIFVSNLASKDKMAEAWHEGLTANSPSASGEVKGAFNTLASWMEDMKEGQKMVFTYVPGTGTTVDVAGKVKGTLPGKATADAILNTWIGPKPGPGEDFKTAVLGK